MFKIPLCCVHRSRYKVSYRPSRQSLAKAAGRGTEGEEIITLTFVRERDERGGVAEDTGLKLHTDAKGMYVHSVRPDSVGAPDCKKASASWRSGGFSQCQIMPEAAPSSGQPRSASQPLWPCCPPYRACFRHRRVDWAFAGRWAHYGQRAGVYRRAAGGEDDHEQHVVLAQGEAGLV
jgi:hypothetical protein